MSISSIPPMRLERLRAIIAAKAEQHADLRGPLTIPGLRRICEAEGVNFVIQPYPKCAQLIPASGTWTIVIDRNQSNEAILLLGCHELGHLLIHHDSKFARWQTAVYDHSSPSWKGFEEAEADAFADLLVRGPIIHTPPRPFAEYDRPTDSDDPLNCCGICGVELGRGHGKVQPARGRRVCVECAAEYVDLSSLEIGDADA